MQKPDLQKREDILAAAARMFCTQPFHEVRLDDIAKAAKTSKGTIYTYFKDKDDLYLSLVRNGLSDLASSLSERVADDSRPSLELIEEVLGGMVEFGKAHPHMSKLLDSTAMQTLRERLDTPGRRIDMLIEQLIRRGVARGELFDTHPHWTALAVKTALRTLIHAERPISAELLPHMMRLLTHGLAHCPESAPSSRRRAESKFSRTTKH